MFKSGLSKKEVKKRLIRLQNLERLYLEQKMRIGLLEEQIKLLTLNYETPQSDFSTGMSKTPLLLRVFSFSHILK